MGRLQSAESVCFFSGGLRNWWSRGEREREGGVVCVCVCVRERESESEREREREREIATIDTG
jgi:hypothetical protein